MSGARFAAVILAAGLSSRMRQLKPLLPLGDATITDFAASTFHSLHVDVFLVVGYRKEEVVPGIKTHGITIVYNPDFEEGMFTSIQAGIRRLQYEHQAFFILPVDIPLVTRTTIKQMINAGVDNPGCVIYPTFEGKRGHPPLIPSVLIPEILSWQQEGGLKTFLQSYEKNAMDVPVNDSFILFDVDTPEDYKKLLKYYQNYNDTAKHPK